MLKVRGKESYYTIDKEMLAQKNVIDATSLPLPRVATHNLLSFEKWQEKYNADIEAIYLHVVDFLLSSTSDKHIVHFDMQNIKKQLVKKLYWTSENRRKHFI